MATTPGVHLDRREHPGNYKVKATRPPSRGRAG